MVERTDTLPSIAPPSVLAVDGQPDLWLRLSDGDGTEELRETMAANIGRLSEYQHFYVEDNINATRRGLKSGTTVPYTLVMGKSAIGSATLHHIDRDERTANIGYWIDREYEGRGYAFSAVRRLVDYGFEEMGLEMITFEIAPDNTRSIRLAERLGARLNRDLASAATKGDRTVYFKLWEIIADE